MVNIDEIKGKIKQASGDLTDDQALKLEGHLQEALGKGKDAGEDILNNVSKEINEMIEKFKKDKDEDK